MSREPVYDPTIYQGSAAHYRSGRPPYGADLTRDVDGVISGYLSMSWCAPHLFGDRLDAFVADTRAVLADASPTGRFWDWPGDTAVIIARKSEELDVAYRVGMVAHAIASLPLRDALTPAELADFDVDFRDVLERVLDQVVDD